MSTKHHVGILERRAVYLEGRIESGSLREAARTFEERELVAIREGIRALANEERRADLELALSELVDAIVEGSETHGAVVSGRVFEALARAQAVLALGES